MKTLKVRLCLAALLCAGSHGAISQPEVEDPTYCLTCHGAAGQGNPAIEAPVLAGMSSTYLERQLKHFRSGIRGTHDKDTAGAEMHGMARVMSDEGIRRAVAFVADLPARRYATTGIQGDLAAGEKVYQTCSTCHGPRAKGNEALSAPGLDYQEPTYLRRQLTHFRDAIRGSSDSDVMGQQMAAVSTALSDDDIINVVAYIKSLGR